MGDLTRITASMELNSVQWRQELDKVTQKQREFRRQNKATGKEVNAFGNHMRNTARNVAVIQGPLGGVAGRLSSIASIASSGAGPAIVGVGAAVSGLTFLLYQSVQAFAEVERSQLRSQALLKATGHAAGLTSQELETMAINVGRDTLASAAGVRKAQGILLTFRTIQGDTFERAIELSQDLAEVMGTDVSTGALQLGKALESPTIGLTALRRSGVSFTESEQEMIKEMERTGRIAEAQTFILDKLAQQVGGAGAGAGQGLAGKADLLKENWSLLLETLGSTSAGEAAGSLLDSLSSKIEGLLGMIAPDDNVVFNELFVGLEGINSRIADIQAQTDGKGIFGNAGLLSELQILKQQKAVLESEYDDLLARRLAIQKEAQLAEEGAAAATVQAESERAASIRKTKEEQGAKSLLFLEQQLRTEDEKRQFQHDKNLERIRSLHVSEAELAKRGFETLAELRDQFTIEEDERYATEQEKIAERHQAKVQLEIDREKVRQERLAERHAEELERDLERQKDREEKLAAGIEEFKEKVARQDEIRAAKKISLDNTVTDNAIGLSKQLFKEGSTARRLLVIAEKAVAIARIRFNTAAGVTKALADGNPGLIPAIKAGGNLALAEVLATDLSGIAHGGLENVPSEGTYLLDKGERVLSARQNEDLTSALRSNQFTPALNVIINEAPGVRAETSILDGILTIDMLREDLANGGDFSQTLQDTHNVQRRPDR